MLLNILEEKTFFKKMSLVNICLLAAVVAIFFEGLSVAEVTVGLHDSRGQALRASLGQTRNLL